ncbi:MAG: pentapeptide repeat-containing protein [Cyanobacteria bacterium P01_F01_bin.53]
MPSIASKKLTITSPFKTSGYLAGWLKRVFRSALFMLLFVTFWFGSAVGPANFPVNSSFAATAATVRATGEPRIPLTVKLLEERLAQPIRQGGSQVVDLSNLIVDLRTGELRADGAQGQTPFSEQFYKQLRQELNAGANASGVSGNAHPLGLDLSHSLVQGPLDFSRLGLRVPAYGQTILPALEAFNQEFQPLLSKDSLTGGASRGRFSVGRATRTPTDALARSLLIQPRSVALLDTLVFQGPLLLNQTCFNGEVGATNLYFLNRVEASQVIFTQPVTWKGARFARRVDFGQGQFQQESSFRGALFAGKARFDQASFSGATNWEGSAFHDRASFAQADFHTGNFARSHWQADADFDQAVFHGPISFQKSRFDDALFLTDAQFDAAANFRQAQFQSTISLRGAHILNQLDFGDALFSKDKTINVADLDFNPGEAKILGSPGRIGQVFSVPALASNETVLRNLVRNFRLLEQIGDANQLEYTTERLRLRQIKRKILGTSLNQASRTQLVGLGFSVEQARAVIERRRRQPFVSRTDLLGMDEIDLASYLKVRDRLITKQTNLFIRGQQLIRWVLLAGLLLLSQYGTNVWLTIGVGLISTSAFAILFWGVDRYRRRVPTPIVPTPAETACVMLGAAGLFALALSLLSQDNVHVLWTLEAVALVVLPVPLAIIIRLYQQGRYHDLMDSSYLVENGALRQLQVLIARLPTVPKYPFYRDRYSPILIDRRWNWLNYFDFSFNNWFKFGFNDIRLRDKAVPGLISTLVWYQWSLGVAYITLLLWTLSRTIPGLNLLLYF